MFAYAAMERIIAKIHTIETADELASFGARLKHLQKLGLFRSSPGKGQKIEYTKDDLFFWAICFELIEIGLPPLILKDLAPRLVSISDGIAVIGALAPVNYFLLIRCNFYQRQLKRLSDDLVCHLMTKEEVDEELNDERNRRAIVIACSPLFRDLTLAIQSESPSEKLLSPMNRL